MQERRFRREKGGDQLEALSRRLARLNSELRAAPDGEAQLRTIAEVARLLEEMTGRLTGGEVSLPNPESAEQC